MEVASSKGMRDAGKSSFQRDGGHQSRVHTEALTHTSTLSSIFHVLSLGGNGKVGERIPSKERII